MNAGSSAGRFRPVVLVVPPSTFKINSRRQGIPCRRFWRQSKFKKSSHPPKLPSTWFPVISGLFESRWIVVLNPSVQVDGIDGGLFYQFLYVRGRGRQQSRILPTTSAVLIPRYVYFQWSLHVWSFQWISHRGRSCDEWLRIALSIQYMSMSLTSRESNELERGINCDKVDSTSHVGMVSKLADNRHCYTKWCTQKREGSSVSCNTGQVKVLILSP